MNEKLPDLLKAVAWFNIIFGAFFLLYFLASVILICGVFGWSVNCTHPTGLSSLATALLSISAQLIGAYAIFKRNKLAWLLGLLPLLYLFTWTESNRHNYPAHSIAVLYVLQLLVVFKYRYLLK